MSDQPMRETELRHFLQQLSISHDALLQRLATVEQERDAALATSRSWRSWISFVLTDNGPAIQSLPDEDFRMRIAQAWDAHEGRAKYEADLAALRAQMADAAHEINWGVIYLTPSADLT